MIFSFKTTSTNPKFTIHLQKKSFPSTTDRQHLKHGQYMCATCLRINDHLSHVCMPPARDRGITGGGGSCHKLNKLTYVWLSLQTRRGSIGLPGLSSRPYDVCVCTWTRGISVELKRPRAFYTVCVCFWKCRENGDGWWMGGRWCG